MNRKLFWLLPGAAVVASLLLLSFVAGITYERVAGPDIDLPVVRQSARNSSMEGVLDEVRGIIIRQALDPSSEQSMTVNAVRGLLGSLGDPYAEYFDKKHFGYLNEQNKGAFVGVGITVSVKDGKAKVVNTFKDSPAAKAGMKPEDEIVAVDGVKKSPWVLEDVVARIRGEEGTKVRLTLRRAKVTEPFDRTITRAKIEVPNIESEMVGTDIGYLRLYSFNERSAQEVQDALEELKRKGARGYVVDVRDNPGGLLDASVEVASLFLEDGTVVRVESRTRPEEEHQVRGGFKTKAPVVILMNENSASASEILAGALQDYGRAKLVGVKSFGKGSVQTVERLSNGGAVKMTTAHYLTPKKRSIDKKGLQPDVAVKMDPRLQAERKDDVQFKRAVEILRGEL